VNNDHTPLSPPVVAEVNVTAASTNLTTMSVENVTINLVAQSMAFNTSKITVPAGAHVTSTLITRMPAYLTTSPFMRTGMLKRPYLKEMSFPAPRRSLMSLMLQPNQEPSSSDATSTPAS
jgi:hypothetical protein